MDLKASDNRTQFYAVYKNFSISNSSDNYRLTLSDYTGNAGDAMLGSDEPDCNLNGQPFTTIDRDYDPRLNLPEYQKFSHGGWWYGIEDGNDCNCTCANLNGFWDFSSGKWFDAVRWKQISNNLDDNYIFFSEMKLRQVPLP